MTSDQYQATFKDLVSKGFRLRQVSGDGVGNQDLYAAIWEKSGGPNWEAHHRMTSDQYQATFKDLVRKGFRRRQVSGYGVGNQDLYAAIWEKSGGPTWEAHHRMTSDQYQATFKDLVSKGFRLRQVSGYGVGNQDLYAAIWEKSGGPTWEAHHRMTSDQYQATFKDLVSKGFRLRQVSGYGVGNQDLYAAIWEKSGGPTWEAHHRMTSDQYQATFKDLVSKGFRLRQVSGYGVGNQDLYALIWEKSGGPTWEAHHRMTSDQYQATFKDLVSKGFRLRQVSGYGVGNQDLYAAIWEKSGGPTWEAHHRMTSDQYQATFNDLVSKGFRLRQVSGYGVGNQDLYAAIWEKSGGATWEAHHRMTSDQYQGQFDQLVDQGYRLVWVSGYGVGTAAYYAALWQSEAISDADLSLIDSRLGAYVQQQSIPGLSFAVTKGERLVFAKGYGYADKSLKQPVTPDSIFRIASISKPVTAVAVMELVEAGKLHLDDTVFGSGAILGSTYGTKPYAANVQQITVRRLASHTSGWSNDGGDPMFMNPSMTQAQLIGWVLDNRPLKNDPGKAYEYLNFGFCVLGRVIEKVSGKGYEDF